MSRTLFLRFFDQIIKDLNKNLFLGKVFAFSGVFAQNQDLTQTEEYQLIKKKGGEIRSEITEATAHEIDYVLTTKFKGDMKSHA